MSADDVNGPILMVEARPRRRLVFRDQIGLTLIGIMCLTILLSVAGAYDTDDYSMPHRLGLWFIISVTFVGNILGIDWALGRLISNGGPRSVIISLGALIVSSLFVTVQIHFLKYTPIVPWAPDPFFEFWGFISLPVFAVGTLLLWLKHYLSPASEMEPALDARPPSRLTAIPVIAGLLPAPLKRAEPAFVEWPMETVLKVRAVDHYLDVTTDGGNSFVRARMKDAVLRLVDAEGLQVHRSWWVRKDQVERIDRRGRDHVIQLKDGTEVPVARSRLKDLRDKGWVSN